MNGTMIVPHGPTTVTRMLTILYFPPLKPRWQPFWITDISSTKIVISMCIIKRNRMCAKWNSYMVCKFDLFKMILTCLKYLQLTCIIPKWLPQRQFSSLLYKIQMSLLVMLYICGLREHDWCTCLGPCLDLKLFIVKSFFCLLYCRDKRMCIILSKVMSELSWNVILHAARTNKLEIYGVPQGCF